MEGELGEHDSGRLKREPAEGKAARRRLEATLTLPAVTRRLRLGTWKGLSSKLRRWNEANEIRKRRAQTTA